MAFGMKRGDLQAIATVKLEDAILLLSHMRFSNAYYLAGYAVEIGLKSCIAQSIFKETIPDKAFVNAIYSHKFRDLVGVAGLTQELLRQQDSDPAFAANWALVAQWSPEARYVSIDPYTAQLMLKAVVEESSGVFPWIKLNW